MAQLKETPPANPVPGQRPVAKQGLRVWQVAAVAVVMFAPLPVAWLYGERMKREADAAVEAERAAKDAVVAAIAAAPKRARGPTAAAQQLGAAQSARDAEIDFAESLGATRLSMALLRAADAAVEDHDPATLRRTRAMLLECSKELARGEKDPAGARLLAMNAAVGVLLAKHGPTERAEPHLLKAMQGINGVPPVLRVDVTYALLAARLWRGASSDDIGEAVRWLDPALPDGPIADLLRKHELRCEAAAHLRDTQSEEKFFQKRIELARKMERDEPSARIRVQRALLDHAAFLLQEERDKDAEKLLRDRLAELPAEDPDGFRVLTQTQLAWLLLDRGKMDESTALTRGIQEQIDAATVSPAALSDRLLSTYLLVRKDWRNAEKALSAYWKTTTDVNARPGDREWAAWNFKYLFEGSGRPELATAWQQTYEQLRAAREALQNQP